MVQAPELGVQTNGGGLDDEDEDEVEVEVEEDERKEELGDGEELGAEDDEDSGVEELLGAAELEMMDEDDCRRFVLVTNGNGCVPTECTHRLSTTLFGLGGRRR